MNNFNYDFITTNLDRPWSFKLSEDGKTAVIGFGDDNAQLTQFDIEKKEVSKSYWTEGSYTSSIEFLTNSKVIVGTSNGFVLFIDLERKEILNKNKISNNSIKNIKLANDNSILYFITNAELISLDANSLELLHRRDLTFNPWDIILIPESNFLVIGGTENKLELLDCNSLEIIDSKTCGEKHHAIGFLSFNKVHNSLFSGGESGFLNAWRISSEGLQKFGDIEFNSDISYIQSNNQYLLFSTDDGHILIDFEKKNQFQIEGSKGESRFSLQKIENKFYLFYQEKNTNLSIINLEEKDKVIYQLKDLPYGIRFIDMTSNGDLIAVNDEGIIVSNFIKKSKVEDEKQYDFNSKEKNIAVEKFIFNEIDESIALQCKDETLKVISLEDTKIFDIDLSFNDIYGLEIKDFYENNILLSTYKDVYIINSETNSLQEIITQDDNFSSIKNIKLINGNQYAIVNTHDYEKHLKVYSLKGQEISSKSLGSIYSSMFISNDKLVTTYINSTFNSPADYKPSKIINLNTNEVKEFDIGYCFEENDGTMLFDSEKYAIRIAIGSHFNHYITCYNLMEKDNNGDANVMWKNEAPWLSSFEPLGFCKIDGYFYIVNKKKGEIISLDINNGNIISSYRIQRSIEDIKMSNSGKYIAWRLKTGEFSYISYPFKSCEVSDE